MGFLRHVRVQVAVAAESATIPSLYAPVWSEPRLNFTMETKVNGRLRHGVRWALSRSFTWSTRLVTVPVGAAVSATAWLLRATVGTVFGLVGAGAAEIRSAARGDHDSRALRRGFIKGMLVGTVLTAYPLGLASGVALAPAALVGAAGAIAFTLPVAAVGTAIDALG